MTLNDLVGCLQNLQGTGFRANPVLIRCFNDDADPLHLNMMYVASVECDENGVRLILSEDEQ